MLGGGVLYLFLVALLSGRRLALDADLASRHVSVRLKALLLGLHAFKVTFLSIPGVLLLGLYRPWLGLAGWGATMGAHAVLAGLWRLEYRRQADHLPRRRALIWAARLLLLVYAVQLAAAAPLCAASGAPSVGEESQLAGGPRAYLVPYVGIWSILDAYLFPDTARAPGGPVGA